MTQIEVKTYKHYGKVLAFDNGKVEAYVTLEKGPRVIKFNAKGMENMMYNQPADAEGLDVEVGFGKGEKWLTYGGHRMWVSPEGYPYTYYPDKTPVKYEIKGNSAEITADVQIHNLVQYTWLLTLDDEKFTIEMRLRNCDKKVRKGAIWGITVTDVGGFAAVKQPQRNKDLLPNRVFAMWPYTRMNDDRLYFGQDYTLIRHSDVPADACKIGLNNLEGKIYCFNKGQLFTKAFDVNFDKEYPDYGVNCELYTNPRILEIESLGNLTDIAPNETVVHKEYWTVEKLTEEPVFDEKWVKKILD